MAKIFFDLFRIDKINYGKTNILTTAHDTDRSYLIDGKYYSPLIDTIEGDVYKITGQRCISIARIISEIKGDKSYGNVYSPEGRFARALLSKRIKGILKRGEYPYSNMEERIWGDILDKTGAKKVFGILPSREMCVACRKRGIWVTDVQHGVIAKNHPWYGKKFRGNEPTDYAPNSFLVWNQESADVINEWALEKGVKAQIIGNRWLARFKNPQTNDVLVQKALTKINHFFENKPSKPVILVSLAWGPGAFNGQIPPNILSVLKRTGDKYQWFVRLHPNQIKGFSSNEFKNFLSFYEKNLKGIIEWELPTYSPLPAVLTKVDLHLSWRSSVSIEAAQLGVKTALLDHLLHGDLAGDYFNYYHKLKMIDFIENSDPAVEKWIEDNLNKEIEGESYKEFDKTYNDFLKFITA